MDPVLFRSRTQDYFDAWNARDDAKLRKLLDVNVSLTDWDTSARGVDEVVKANQHIWEAIPKVCISIELEFLLLYV